MQKLLNGHEKRCFHMFRMTQSTFHQLCMDLESKYGLFPSDRISTLENVDLFVFTLSKGASNDIQERFQHFGEAISRILNEVLNIMDDLSRDIIRPRDLEFKEIPSQIANDTKYMPYFKDCIGAIDDTHIDVIIREENQLCYRGRKGTPTVNVLETCDFDLLFTYVLNDQNRIICVAFALHNYIRSSKALDPTFKVIDAYPNFISSEAFLDTKCISTQEVEHMSNNEMTKIRNDITTSLIATKQQRRVS
ncbi:hypothetical protein J1N35_028716 [Gossypium stocksii]|uniref:DUF8040 domain-containing protein n=1 Tax=Gossypium stocksii TaxID=47602 RepID=A0A9D3ZS98_9ROSI|nr:hypothetical protein J1N35_028716 [Gossypium stocksii]